MNESLESAESGPIAKIADNMFRHPHCYQWTLALIGLFLLVGVGGTAAGFISGFTLGAAIYGQIKRTLARGFYVA